LQSLDKQKIDRVIDANCNRAKEGLRVCEDVCRFVLDDEKISSKFKELRHKLKDFIESFGGKDLIKARDIESDVGKATKFKEFERKDIVDIFFANIQRVKESMRVLEEFAKLYNQKDATLFKNMRYELYAIEKEVSLLLIS